MSSGVEQRALGLISPLAEYLSTPLIQVVDSSPTSDQLTFLTRLIPRLAGKRLFFQELSSPRSVHFPDSGPHSFRFGFPWAYECTLHVSGFDKEDSRVSFQKADFNPTHQGGLFRFDLSDHDSYWSRDGNHTLTSPGLARLIAKDLGPIYEDSIMVRKWNMMFKQRISVSDVSKKEKHPYHPAYFEVDSPKKLLEDYNLTF